MEVEVASVDSKSAGVSQVELAAGTVSEPRGDDLKIQVRFITRQKAYSIPETPVFVPVKLRRYELSEIVNHLLCPEKPIAFEFVLDNQLLLGSLRSHIAKYNLPTEGVIDIEYIVSQPKPSNVSACDYNDWISSISVCGNINSPLILTGSFGGEVAVWDSSGSIIQKISNEFQVNAVEWLTGPDLRDGMLAYGGENFTLTVAKLKNDKSEIVKVFSGNPTSSVSCIKAHSNGASFAFGCWDGRISLWSNGVMLNASSQSLNIYSEQDPEEISQPVRKIRVREDDTSSEQYSVVEMNGAHLSAVSCVALCPGGNLPRVGYSGSHDHSILQWDFVTGNWVHSIDTGKAISCMDYSSETGAILTGHTDNSIKLWDTRDSLSSSKITPTSNFYGLSAHKSWVSSVKWAPEGYSPSSCYSFASVAYDGSLKIWDIRFSTPIHSIQASQENSKIFALDWVNKNTLVVGGQDCKLKFFN